MSKTIYLTSPCNRHIIALREYLLKVDVFDIEKISVIKNLIRDLTEEKQKSVNYAKEPEFIVLTKAIKEHLVTSKGSVLVQTGVGSFSDKIIDDKITIGEFRDIFNAVVETSEDENFYEINYSFKKMICTDYDGIVYQEWNSLLFNSRILQVTLKGK